MSTPAGRRGRPSGGAWRVVGAAALGWMGAVQLGALLALGLGGAAERQALDPARLLALWAGLAPALAWFGGALTGARLRARRVLLALATTGHGPAVSLVAAALSGALVGLCARAVGGDPLADGLGATAWARGEGGWLGGGGWVLPDPGVGEVHPWPEPAAPLLLPALVAGLAAAAGLLRGVAGGAGAALVGGMGLLLAVVLAEGARHGGAAPTLAAGVPAFVALLLGWSARGGLRRVR